MFHLTQEEIQRHREVQIGKCPDNVIKETSSVYFFVCSISAPTMAPSWWHNGCGNSKCHIYTVQEITETAYSSFFRIRICSLESPRRLLLSYGTQLPYLPIPQPVTDMWNKITIISLDRGFQPRKMPHRGHLTISKDILGWYKCSGDCYWHPVGRGQ